MGFCDVESVGYSSSKKERALCGFNIALTPKPTKIVAKTLAATRSAADMLGGEVVCNVDVVVSLYPLQDGAVERYSQLVQVPKFRVRMPTCSTDLSLARASASFLLEQSSRVSGVGITTSLSAKLHWRSSPAGLHRCYWRSGG